MVPTILQMTRICIYIILHLRNQDQKSEKLIHPITKKDGPLEIAEILDNSGYEKFRMNFLKLSRVVKASRRVFLDSNMYLLFENRLTVWTQIQEELRWQKQPSDDAKNDLLDIYNVLISPNYSLGATLFIISLNTLKTRGIGNLKRVESLHLRLKLNGILFGARAVGENSHFMNSVNFVRFEKMHHVQSTCASISWWEEKLINVKLSRRIIRALNRDNLSKKTKLEVCHEFELAHN